MGWVVDLDGVLWLGEQPIDGAAAAVARLRDAGEDVVFCTNNSSQPVAAQEAKLAAHGVPAEGAVVTSAMAGAGLVEPGERVLVCGGPGIVEALDARGATVVEAGPADVVLVGFDLRFDYARLLAAHRAVHDGARLLATNTDATFPTPDGPIPGGGAIVAAIAYATGVEPVVAGKPHGPMATLLLDRLGPHGTVVGDRPDTDGRLAEAMGYRFALVLSGVTGPADLPTDPPGDLVGLDLATVVAAALAP